MPNKIHIYTHENVRAARSSLILVRGFFMFLSSEKRYGLVQIKDASYPSLFFTVLSTLVNKIENIPQPDSRICEFANNSYSLFHTGH
jgi:hypothetical protein